MQQPIEAGQILNGKYKIIRLIGEGGMARVWLAEEMAFGHRRVAIKEPKTESDEDQHADAQRRFTQELEINAALSVRAPSVVPTYTVEQWGDRPLLVMAYMAGGDLDSRIREAEDGLSVESAIAVTRSLLTALQAAHNHAWEIVHRDIKPANVLFDEAGNAYLADFGLAQLTGSSSNRTKLMGGAQPGTPNYMAPEQFSSTAPLTLSADIYALGCVLFEMLTGKRYKRMEPGTRVTKLRRDIPAWLDALVARAVAKNPWERFEDGAAMLAALNAGALRPTFPLLNRWMTAVGTFLAYATGYTIGWIACVLKSNRWMAAVGALLVLTLITWGATRWLAPPAGEVTPTPNPIAANPTLLITPTPTPDLDATDAWTILAPAETATPPASSTPSSTPQPTAVSKKPTATQTNAPPAEATPTNVVIRINPAPAMATLKSPATPIATHTTRPSSTPTVRPNLTATAAMQTVIAYQSRTITPTPSPTLTPTHTRTPTLTPTRTHTPTPDHTATVASATSQARATADAATATSVALQASLIGTAEALGVEASDLKLDPETGMLVRVNPINGAEYVSVPASALIMGSEDGDSDERPVHKVTLDAFWIMRTEVTNAQYGKCVVADVCSTPNNSRWNDSRYAQHPVTHVNWNQATTYARWAGGRLPTEAEWEKACRGTDIRIYPWGNQSPTTTLLNFNNNVRDTTVVSSYAAGASPYGALDMVGNVWEWTEDRYAGGYYSSSPANNPTGPTTGSSHVLRGGSFLDSETSIRCANRNSSGEDFRGFNVGFRVVVPSF